MVILHKLLQLEQPGAHNGEVRLGIIRVPDGAGIDVRVEVARLGRRARLAAEEGQHGIRRAVGVLLAGAAAQAGAAGALVLAEEDAVGEQDFAEEGVGGHDGFFVELVRAHGAVRQQLAVDVPLVVHQAAVGGEAEELEGAVRGVQLEVLAQGLDPFDFQLRGVPDCAVAHQLELDVFRGGVETGSPIHFSFYFW